MTSVVDQIYELMSKQKGDDGKAWGPADLARACGKTPAWVNKRIGRGEKTKKVKLNLDDLAIIARAFNLQAPDLLPGSLSSAIKKMTVYDFLNKIVADQVEKYCAELEAKILQKNRG